MLVEFEGQQIEVPDDATDEEINTLFSAPLPPAPKGPSEAERVVGAVKDAVGSVVAPAANAAPGAPPASADDWIRGALGTGARVGTHFAAGTREGAMNFLGLPVDIANNLPRLLNVIPGVDGVKRFSDMGSDTPRDPVGGGNWFNRAVQGGIEAVGGNAMPEASTGPERFARRVGQEVGSVAVPGAGVMIKAGQLGTQGVREAGPIAQMFLEKAAVSPQKYAVGELGAGVAAGAGAGTAGEISRYFGKEPGALTDTAGALGGLGVAAIGNVGSRMAKTMFDSVFAKPTYVDDVVRNEVTSKLATALGAEPNARGVIDTDPFVAQIEGGRRINDVVPEFRESLADRTGNANVAALEYGRSAAAETGVFANRRAENNIAIDAAIDRSAPNPTATPGALRQELASERARRLDDAENQRLTAESTVEAAMRPVTPATTPTDRGNVVRNEILQAQDAAKERTRQAYRDANVGQNSANPAPLTDALDAEIAGLTAVERRLVPAGAVDAVRNLGRPPAPDPNAPVIYGPDGNPLPARQPQPAPINLDEATTLVSELKKLQRAARSDPNAENGGENAARVIGGLIDRTDDFIRANSTPEQQAALDRASGIAKAEKEAFTRPNDPLAAAIAQRQGRFNMNEERVAGSIAARPQNIDTLFQHVDTPAARGAIREELLARGDLSNSKRAREFMDAHKEQIDRFPGLRDELDAAASAREAAEGATTNQTRLTKELGTENSRGTSTVGQYLKYGAENYEKAMEGLFRADKPIEAADEIMRFAGDKPAAVQGARKAFWDIMQGNARAKGNTTRDVNGRQPWNGERLREFLTDPGKRAVAERIYRDNPEHLQNLDAIAEALQRVDTRNAGKANNASGTSQGNRATLSPESLQSRFYAYTRGQVGAAYLATSIAATFFRNRIKNAQQGAVGRLLDDALLNPEVAALLLKENNPANRAALAKKAQNWKIGEISKAARGDDEDETIDAVTRGNPGQRN